MLLRHISRVPFLLRPYRNFSTTLIKLKDDKFETYYEMLGVHEDADGMQIEDAFVNVITGDEARVETYRTFKSTLY